MKGRLLFQEEQAFKYTWSWWVLIIVTLPVFGSLTYGFYQQILLGDPWGNNPMSDLTMVLVTSSTFVLLGGIIWLFQVMKLVIKVDEGTLSYSFFPFVSSMKNLHKGDVAEMYIRKYDPIGEYGGWGYRTRWKKGKALNVSGKWGLQLIFPTGKKLLLGTQKPEELEQAIKQLKENWGMTD